MAQTDGQTQSADRQTDTHTHTKKTLPDHMYTLEVNIYNVLPYIVLLSSTVC